MRFKRRGMRWMRILHIISTGIWFGATVAVLALGVQGFFASHDDFVAIAATMTMLSWVALASMAVFTLGQAVVYGLWTQWGFFKHRWVLWKWVCVAVLVVLIGAGLVVLSAAADKARAGTFVGGLTDGGAFLALMAAQVAALLVSIWLSVYKPGKAPPSARPARVPQDSQARPAARQPRTPPSTPDTAGPGGVSPAPQAARLADLQAQLTEARTTHAAQLDELQTQLAEALAAREDAMDQIAAAMAELATSTGPLTPATLAATAPLAPSRAPSSRAPAAPTSPAPTAAPPAPAPADETPRPIWLDPDDQPLCNDCGTCYQELPGLFERTTILVDGSAEVVARLKPGALDGLEITSDLARRIARVKDTCDSEIIH